MDPQGTRRRLAAILAADMVGYSRLVEADEAGTLAQLKTHRKELIDPKIAGHNGRVVKTTGDGILIEFASVVGAVECAVDIQRGMARRGAEVPEDRRIAFRVGINFGAIVIDGDDILGDGVNIAARLEGLAEPGGICVSSAVHNDVKNKIDIAFEDLGEKKVKNIAEPIRVYRVALEADAAGMAAGTAPARRTPLRWAIAAAAVAAVAGAAVWIYVWNYAVRGPAPPGEVASVAKMAHPLPDKPSIAVLPFTNMSGDAEQEYFADGITEDIITDLSKVSGLFVIARNSTFTYKGRDVRIRQVAEDLGVRFVLEGSVRRVGDKVRINAQLIDATTGGHLWAERYDGSLADVFALQDKVTQKIVAALAVNLTAEERALTAQAETGTPEAHDAFLRGWSHYRRGTPDDFAEAIPQLERAVALDPDYGRAHAALAAVYWGSHAKDFTSRGGVWSERLGLSHAGSLVLARKHLREAMKNPVPLAHQVASGVRSYQGRHAEAVAEAERAIALDANDPVGHEAKAIALIYAGRPSAGAEAIAKAMRLDPHYPPAYLVWLGLARLGMEKFEAAAESLATATGRNPDDDVGLILLTAVYGHLGRAAEAKSTIAKLNTLRAKRGKSLAAARAKGVEIGIDVFLVGPYTLQDVDLWPFKARADRERLRAGLAKAGVPKVAPASAESPLEVAGATTVDAAAAKALLDRGARFVDVRSRARWEQGHPPGAVSLFLKTDLSEASLSAVAAKDQPLVIYCEGPKCLLSSKSCAKAVSWGFTKVHYFRNGFPGWQAAGYPIEVP